MKIFKAVPSRAIKRKKFNRRLAGHSRLETIMLPIMRHHVDGLAIARVKA